LRLNPVVRGTVPVCALAPIAELGQALDGGFVFLEVESADQHPHRIIRGVGGTGLCRRTCLSLKRFGASHALDRQYPGNQHPKYCPFPSHHNSSNPIHKYNPGSRQGGSMLNARMAQRVPRFGQNHCSFCRTRQAIIM
jgi:hypothetical protein